MSYQKFVGTIIFTVLILAVLPLISDQAYAAQSYAVAGGNMTAVNEWAECRNITNAAGYSTIFVPTNTATEWSEFRLHYPAGISLGTCGPSMPSYTYRRKITITSSAALTSYPVKFAVDTASLVASGKMQSDCDDARVTDLGGTAIDYVVELCNTANSEIWAEVPSITNGATEIYMFYGNPSAVAGGNGNNVFSYYNNFENGSLAGWITGWGPNSGSYYPFTVIPTTLNTVTISSTVSQSTPNSMHLWGKSACYNPSKSGKNTFALRSFNPASGTYILQFRQRGSGGQFNYCTGGAAGQNDVLLDDTAMIYNNPTCNYTACNTCTVEWLTAMSSAITFSGTARSFRFRSVSSDCETTDGWIDDIKLRKYSSPDPTTSVGPEELI
jgi:hypothetical protein